MIHISVELYCI